MHVLFVEPGFPANQGEFVRALAEVGARVTGIGESPLRALPRDLLASLDGYEQVGSVVHEPSLEAVVRQIQEREWVDRLEATVEAHVLGAARVREACSIPGTTERTAWLCRDKPAMKEALRKAGVPCARSTGAHTVEGAVEFCEDVGYPIIVKPLDAAGAAATYRVENRDELDTALSASGVGQGAAVALEEFIEGHEGFYDTLTCRGEVVHEFASHYFPGVLEAMRTRWVSPQIVSTNRLEQDSYDELREMGRKVIKVLGIETSATHMEWFFGPKGLIFSEIGCRPPGVRVWDLYGAGNDLDLYREWASLLVHERPTAKASRRSATGMIALRPDRDGEIAGYSGADQVERLLGDGLIDHHFPPKGTPTQPVSAGYMANAWIRAQHSDYDALCGLLDRVGETVKVHAQG